MSKIESLRIGEFAHGRSGDKGNHANIAVIAYTPDGFEWLRQKLTADVVQEYFRSFNPSRVERYEVPNILAFNFVLYDVLGGGASRSLRVDTQGKALAISLLSRVWIEAPEDWQKMTRRGARTKS